MYEQHICIMKGREHFKLVSPIFRKNIYAGTKEEFSNSFSPLDFFNVDFQKYPLAAEVKFIDAVVEAGDCLYVPSYYYIQSKTLNIEGND